MAAPEMRVSWRTVAIGSMLLNLGAIGTIATIATVRGGDALATVALALAIVAFICQLIVFSVQTWQSGEQLKQAERLNSETHGLIGEIRTRLESTHEMVATQYRELLHLAALKSEVQIIKTGEQEDVSQASISASALESVADSHVEAPSGLLDEKYLHSALEWPAVGDIPRFLKVLEPLPDETLTALTADATIDAMARYVRQPPTGPYGSTDQPLVEAGLAIKLPGDSPEKPRVQLTEKGRIAARLLLANWPPPEDVNDIADQIWAVRERSGPKAASYAETIRGNIGS